MTPTEALLKIEQCKSNHSKALYLSNLGLTEIPSEIVDFYWLEYLSLSHNQITKIEGLDKLVNISGLHLSSNQITKIEGLDKLVNISGLSLLGNQITKIEGLDKLINISGLSLANNQITKIESLDKLVNISTLLLSYNQITKIEGIDKLINISVLSLDNNQITKIESLDKLVNISKLSLSNNQIENIFPLENLIQKGIPVILKSGYVSDDKYINLFGNPLQTPDLRIVKLGNTDILNYFKQVSEQSNTGLAALYEARLIIVGEPGAGKTSLTEKLIDETHLVIPQDPKKESTLGINIKENWQFEDLKRKNENFTAHIWDFGGQEIQYMTHQFFLTPESLYVLVADDRKQHTLFPYWFEIIHLLGKSETGKYSPIVVLLNEQKNKSISNFDLNEYRSKYPNTQIDVLEVDLAATDLSRFRAVKVFIQNKLCTLSHIGRPLPGKWPLIRKAIMSLNKDRNHIGWNEFAAICQTHQVTDTTYQELISRYLHRLGVILHFQDEKSLKDFIIINPSWAMKAIYLVLENKSVEANSGRFTEQDLDKFWEGLTLSEQANMLSLMKKNNFEICYSVDAQPNLYIAPQLLPKIRPEFEWNRDKSLKFQYFYRFMPKGIMTRLIVRKHEYLSEHVWARGAIFDRYECNILVTEEETEKDGLIAIEVIGKPINYIRSLNFIRDEIEAIHEKWFSSITYEEKAPCNCKDCINSQTPTFFSWNKLLQRVEQNKRTIECDNNRVKDVEVLSLLEGVYDKKRIEQIYKKNQTNFGLGDGKKEEAIVPEVIKTKTVEPVKDEEQIIEKIEMEDQKKNLNWLWAVIILFGLYMLFVKFAPNGSKFDILGMFKGEKGIEKTSTDAIVSVTNSVTIIGKIKINGKNPHPGDVKQVYIKDLTAGPKSSLDNDLFKLKNIDVPSDRLVSIAVDLKNNEPASQLFKLPQPDKDGVCDIGEVLLEANLSQKQSGKMIIVFKNQNIQNNGGTPSSSQK